MLPNDVTLLTGQADALFDLNRIPEAIMAYQRALHQDPANVDIKKKLERCRIQKTNQRRQVPALERLDWAVCLQRRLVERGKR